METLYNVYIVSKHRKGMNIADARIGENLTSEKAQRRVMMGLNRINEDYFIDDVEVSKDKYKVLINR